MHRRTPSKRISRRYDRLASFYDLIEAPMERSRLASWREKIRDRITGNHVLEAGVGTGKNLIYYPSEVRVTAIDFSPRMLKVARKKAAALHCNSDLLEMDVQCLAFPANSFDTVLATFVFCSVPDPVRGLRELRRVCRPGGRLFLLEHMRPGNPLLGLLFDLINPMVVRVMGANINRRTMDNIRKAGWHVRAEDHLLGDIVRWIEAVR